MWHGRMERKRHMVLFLALGVVLAACIPLATVYGACLQRCPKDPDCNTDTTECMSFTHCSYMVVYKADHWLCLPGGTKTECYHHGDKYKCAKLVICTWDWESMMCLPGLIPFEYRERQSTKCS